VDPDAVGMVTWWVGSALVFVYWILVVIVEGEGAVWGFEVEERQVLSAAVV